MITPSSGLMAAMAAMHDANEKAVKAAIRFSDPMAMDESVDTYTALRLAKLQHKANARVVKSLNENSGYILDLVA
ncbi:hypothetical protein QPK87_19315 [Kamptonema cortianum]|nr:hypothetical protein [Geitlerinema splendidum]MDK3158706.1 hypothetical protein [Kamptonema cortianum]